MLIFPAATAPYGKAVIPMKAGLIRMIHSKNKYTQPVAAAFLSRVRGVKQNCLLIRLKPAKPEAMRELSLIV